MLILPKLQFSIFAPNKKIFPRLFVHPKFLDMLRLHSKTIMKLNSALVIFLILSSFVAVFNAATINNTYKFVENVTIVNPNDNPAPKPQYNGKITLILVSSYSMFHLSETDINPCQRVDMDVAICQIFWASQLLFSIHFLVWNLLVAVVLVSVARTQVTKAKVSSQLNLFYPDDQHPQIPTRAGTRCDPS